MDGTDDTLPDLTQLVEGSQFYNPTKVQHVADFVEDAYRLDGDLSPLREALDVNLAEGTTLRLVERALFGGIKRDITRALGTEGWWGEMVNAQTRNTRTVQEAILADVATGYVPQIHGNNTFDVFKGLYNFQPSRVNKGTLMTNMDAVIRGHVSGNLGKEDFYRVAPRY
jgi:hypothetical protein